MFRKYRKSEAEGLLAELRGRASEEEGLKGLRLFLGQEIFWCEETREALQAGEAITMAGGRHVLIEFHPAEVFYEIEKAVRETVTMGYIPIIAHAERFSALSDPARARELRGMGALIQLNMGSISGKLLDRRASYCRKLLKKGHADFIGTDMHDTQGRRPRCAEAASWMERHLDRGMADAVLKGNAERITGGAAALRGQTGGP